MLKLPNVGGRVRLQVGQPFPCHNFGAGHLGWVDLSWGGGVGGGSVDSQEGE